MTTKHTPGPWTAERMRLTPRTTDRRCGFVVNGPDASDDALPVRICDLRVPAGIDGFAEGEANAALIAAAPALLAACQAVLQMCESNGYGRSGMQPMLKRAIAKATNQTAAAGPKLPGGSGKAGRSTE